MCKWCATYLSKAFNEGYNFTLDLISIKGWCTKLWAPKVTRVLVVGISGFPFGKSRDKMPFECGPCGEADNIL
jgi:hypothetical protein